MFKPKEEEKKPWTPLIPVEAYCILKNANCPWWIAGGYAIESFVGRSYRAHEDIDILVLRSNVEEIREVMIEWELFPSDPPGTLRTWAPGESLSNQVHDIWGRKNSQAPWAFQIMINDSDGDDFLYKRNHEVRFNIKTCTRLDQNKIPYVSPEFQLLHKAKSLRKKDILDFKTCLPYLSPYSRQWLKENMLKCYSSDHPWLKSLDY